MSSTAERTPGTERRGAPRHRADVPLELALPQGAGAAATLQDISLSGLRCITAEAVPVMTQVNLVLALPGIDEASIGITQSISCRGAVVRSEAGENGEFDTAVFFTNMADSDRMALQEFLSTLGS